MFKKCCKCKRTKLITEFYVDKKAPDNTGYICKECIHDNYVKRYIRKAILRWVAKAEQEFIEKRNTNCVTYLIYFWSILAFMWLAWLVYILIG